MNDYPTPQPCADLMEKWREEARRKAIAAMSREDMYRFAYVPFVIARLVWEYTDTIIALAAALRLRELKPLARSIRQLREEFYAARRAVLANYYEDDIEDNADVFDEAVEDVITQLAMNIRLDIDNTHPGTDRNHALLLTAAHQADILLQALFVYVDRQRRLWTDKTNVPFGDVLPQPIRKLARIIPLYFGDKPASPRFAAIRQQYIGTLAAQIGRTRICHNDNAKQ